MITLYPEETRQNALLKELRKYSKTSVFLLLEA